MSLKIINLHKAFGGKLIFDGLSYEFSDRGIYALVGESGIGKTTLIRIVAGLEKEYTGEVLGAGIGRTSVAFQEHRLIPHLSAIENVIFAISNTKDEAVLTKAKNLLLRLGFKESDMELKATELSGGMKQRVSLARAFIKEAEILLLDEPTKELDTANADAVRQLIRERSERSLVIMATHNNEDVESLRPQVLSIK